MCKIAHAIKSQLYDNFQPETVEIINESHLHVGHQGHDGSDETHLRIKISAKTLNEMSRLERHRAVKRVVKPFMDTGLHACTIEVN